MDDKTSEQPPAVLAFAQDVSDVSLIDAFIMRMGLALLLSAPLGYGFIGIYTAQAAAPVLPAIIGFAYLRLWARRNSPEKRLP